jgi:hypothetical protein
MTRPASLRAVKAGEARSAERKKSVSEAAASGTHRELLVAMRDRIAKAVQDPDCPPRDLASLSRRLQEISKEIEASDLRNAEEAKESAASPDEAWDAEAL